jgi:hypothetical protein
MCCDCSFDTVILRSSAVSSRSGVRTAGASNANARRFHSESRPTGRRPLISVYDESGALPPELGSHPQEVGVSYSYIELTLRR